MNITIIEEKWNYLSTEEKDFIVEYLKVVYPNKIKLLNEARWWNTVGDIVGIFDPTGIVDLINGIDYIRQGDYFFGLLSMISIIPYVGDAVAKPLMFIGKSSKVMKGANNALKLSKAGKTAEAGNALAKAAEGSSLMGGLLSKVSSWVPKLKSAVDKIPGGKLTGGLKKTIHEWLDLFLVTSKKSKQAKQIAKYSAGKLAKKLPGMSKAEAKSAIKTFKKEMTTVNKNSKIFKNYKPNDPSFMAKYFWPGLSFRNRALKSLVRRTKFYAGFLDFLGLGNWVGPDELPKQMSENDLDAKFQEYVKTPNAQAYWKQDFPNFEQEFMGNMTPQQPTQPSNPISNIGGSDLLGTLFNLA